MTKNNALLKLSDNVKLNRRKNPIAMEMARTKDYYQKTILEAFMTYIPEQAVIYEMDSRFVSHAIYFLKYGHARQVYLFETNRAKYREARNDVQRNHLVGIECLQPNWDTKRFARWDKDQLTYVTPSPADVIHASEAAIEAGLLLKFSAEVEKYKPVLWLDTSSHNFAEIAKWLEKLHYRLQIEQNDQAIYVSQETKEAEEEKNELEAKLLERLETYKRQINQLQQECEQQISHMQSEQAKKLAVMETEHRAVVKKLDEEMQLKTVQVKKIAAMETEHRAVVKKLDEEMQLKTVQVKKIAAMETEHRATVRRLEEEVKQQAELAKQHEQETKQSQKETREARQVVQHISDALNAEKAMNHDLNKRIFALLAEEKPVLLTMEKRQTQQQKELSSLRYENRKLARNLTIATEKYQRLNDTKVIRVMRKYWNFKKKKKIEE
ncbi:hypothetical protein HCB69_00110 [Listeria booriae]|uniref:Uncharacterized protein n=1 Tax=Listeria booriae TaxID=1552123 RepID=A0A842FXX7_9LIST|nr:hypothetical protein [Listeria booriae]MBC2282774.1 hypothetical protein [Listeria booriae]